jgi:hypothetical protein
MPAAKAECRPVRCGRTCSCGRRLSVLSRMIAPRSFKSRYSFVVSYARNTACTVVNMRGLHHAHARAVSHGRQKARTAAGGGVAFYLFRTRFVKMNSNRLPLYFVRTYSACVLPRRRLCADLMFRLTMQLYPIPVDGTSRRSGLSEQACAATCGTQGPPSGDENTRRERCAAHSGWSCASAPSTRPSVGS